MAFVNEENNFRTIDHARGYVLVNTGGGSDFDNRTQTNFSLDIKTDIIEFTGRYDAKKDKDGNNHIDWYLYSFRKNDEYFSPPKKLKDIVIEAFDEFRLSYRRDWVSKVFIEFKSK